MSSSLIPAVAAAANKVGGVTRLAEILGIKRPAIYQWKKVPAERCIPIEAATSGEVTRHELRPDLYPVDSAHAAADSGEGEALQRDSAA